MKKVSILLASLVICFSSLAQEGHKKSPEERAAHMTEKLSTELSLSAEQKTEIEKINATYLADMHAIKENSEMQEEQKHEALKELRKNWKSSVQNELTEEQKAKMEELKEDRKEMQKLTPAEKAENKTAKMKEELGLSEEQTQQVRELNRKVADKIEAIRNDETISPEKKKEFIQGNRKDYKRVLSSILTPEQLTKYEELKKSQRHEHLDPSDEE